MLARLGLWKSEEKEKTRFEQHEELKLIGHFISGIRTKRDAFKAAKENTGAASLSYTKYKIFRALLESIDGVIDRFNEEGKAKRDSDESEQTIAMVKQLADIVYDFNATHSNLLDMKRDDRKEKAAVVADVATFTVILAGGVIASVPVLLTAFGAYMMSPKVGQTVKSVVGLDHPEETASSQLIKSFLVSLQTTYKNLCLDQALESGKRLQNREPRDALCGIISKQVMEDPVICLLDGYTYERSAITKWLAESGKSPMTQTKMEEWQTIKDVLVPNRAIKDLIDEFNEQNLRAVEGDSAEERESPSQLRRSNH